MIFRITNNVPDTIFSNLFTMIDAIIDDDIYERTLTQSMNTYNEELFRKSKDTISVDCVKITLESLDGLLEPKCRICLEDFVQQDVVYRLSCHHDFHCECLEDAVQRKHSNCPLCRTSIPLQIKDETLGSPETIDADNES